MFTRQPCKSSQVGKGVKAQSVQLLKAFGSKRDGNIAILFGFMASVLLLFSGAAVDYSRYYSLQTDLTEALDAAGLAMAQFDDMGGPGIDGLEGAARELKLKEFGRAVFDENFSRANEITDLSVDFNIDSVKISPRATGKVKTLLLHIGERLLNHGATDELEYLEFDSQVEITRRGSGRIELALVLDVTGSMNGYVGGEKKIDSLKDAVDKLLTVMYGESNTNEYVKIGVVPFNAHVNAGGADAWDDTWSDEDAEAYYHGTRFIHINNTGDGDGDGITDIDPNGGESGAEFSNGIARIFDVDTKVNHFDLYNSYTETNWTGCFEARPYPLDELDTVPGTSVNSSTITDAYASLNIIEEPSARMRTAFDRAPNPSLSVSELTKAINSKWVPLFIPDEPNCTADGSDVCRDNWGQTSHTYTLNGTSRTIQTFGYMFDNPDGDSNNDTAYPNRNFVDDYDFTHRYSSGEYFERYADVVIGMRFAIKRTYSELNDYWDDVKARLEELDIDDAGIDEYKLRVAYPGYWDPAEEKYRGHYDDDLDIDEDTNTAGYVTKGASDECPAPVLPLTTYKSDIADHVEALVPMGTTNSANGALWGWRLVSPEAPFTEGEAWDNGQWQKAVVIMTDGENYTSTADTHFESTMTAYGYSAEERMGQGVDTGGRGGSGFSSDAMSDHIDEKLLRICRRMKEQGILVYTIIFGLNDANLEEVFKTCATDTAAPYYYKAPTGEQLETAFGDIAADLVKLHISQ